MQAARNFLFAIAFLHVLQIPSAKAEEVPSVRVPRDQAINAADFQRRKIMRSLKLASKNLQSSDKFQKALRAKDSKAIVEILRSETGIEEPMTWTSDGCISCVGFKICFGGASAIN